MTAKNGSLAPEKSPGTAVLRSVELVGPAGRLEALLNEGSPLAPCAAVVCHPHPKGGGTMHNKVVYHAMKALNAPEFGLSLPVLRFNFRGTGLSEGTYDGTAETEDVLAALSWIENEYNCPLLVVGFSFGAAMSLMACCHSSPSSSGKRNVRAVAALGLPTRAEGHEYRYSFLSHCSIPKLFVSGDRDAFAPVTDLNQVAATTAEPKKLVLIPGADHFFSGRLEAMQNTLAGWCKEQLP
ncbi:MAG TPA: alpha/beta family hydrolase [Terracidiphilus sp.]|jgi:alpha/beta superfamily hydrolase|nr:alpha/beta family hydrolase [Terracidiphilus sp.]